MFQLPNSLFSHILLFFPQTRLLSSPQSCHAKDISIEFSFWTLASVVSSYLLKTEHQVPGSDVWPSRLGACPPSSGWHDIVPDRIHSHSVRCCWGLIKMCQNQITTDITLNLDFQVVFLIFCLSLCHQFWVLLCYSKLVVDTQLKPNQGSGLIISFELKYTRPRQNLKFEM